MLDQMLRTIRHMQRADKSLVITKGHRDTPLVNVQSRKHIVVPWYKRLASHRSASLAQWLSPLYQSTRCQAQHPSYRSQDRLRVAVERLERFERVPLLERLDHFEHIYPIKRV